MSNYQNFCLGPELMGKEILNDIIDRYKTNNLLYCQFFGVKSTFGSLPDYREASIKQRIVDIKKDIQSVERLIQKEKDDLAKFEKKLVHYKLKSELFDLEVTKPHKKSISVYAEPIANIIMVYVSRSYDTLEVRTKDIINTEKDIPTFLDTALQVLDDVLSKPLIQMGLGFLSGINSFLESELPNFIKGCGNQKLIEEWKQTNDKAIASIKNFITKIKEDYMPKSKDDFKLGEKEFLNLLEASEGIKISIDKLLNTAEKDLTENYAQLEKILSKEKSSIIEEMEKDYPEPETLIEECQLIVNETKKYLKKSKLLTLPKDDDCEVVETPEFRRNFSIASMNLPGLAEPSEGKETYYYITKPDSAWNKDQTVKYMKNFSRGQLHVTTIHEVFPGHFVQGLYYQYVIKSPIIRLFSYSGSMSEGWAHYGEELIVNHGYDRYDRTKVQIGQLLGALKRNVRFICAIKMHCRDMTIDQAQKLFIEKAHLDEGSAKMEAMRGTVEPMYLNYTLGKLMIKKLKKDVMNEKGKKFKEKDFHDSILKLGFTPILLLREQLLQKTPIEDIL